MDAQLGEIKAASSLNPLLKPMALAELDKGKIYRSAAIILMQLIFMPKEAWIIYTYNDLSLKLLKKDDDKNKYKTKVPANPGCRIGIKRLKSAER